MLPIFRIISVGGVSLAILILALALIPPGGTHLLLTPHDTGSRGAMIDRSQHPEWRQFMIQAALRRADELERLRSLPSAPLRLPDVAAPAEEDKSPDAATAAEPPVADEAVAGLQPGAQPAAPDDITGSIDENPGATIPIDIGEASSTELPIGPSEEKPPVSAVQDSRVPELQAAPPPTFPVIEMRETVLPRAKPTMRVMQTRPRHRKPPPAPQAVAPQVPPPFNLLAAIFGGLSRADTTAPAPGYNPASGIRAAAQ